MGEIIGRYLMPHAPVLIEEIGKGSEKKAQSTLEGIRKIEEEVSKKDFDTVLVISPHGYTVGQNNTILNVKSIIGNFNDFGKFSLEHTFNIDGELSEKIVSASEKFAVEIKAISSDFFLSYGIDETLDHGSLVPLHFILKKKQNFSIVDIAFGSYDYNEIYNLGKAIANAIAESDKKVLVIASGDLSHKASEDSPYGFDSRGLKFDKELIKLLNEGNYKNVININRELTYGACECGFRSILMLLGTICDDFYFEKYSYEHPFGIGYMTGKFVEGGQ